MLHGDFTGAEKAPPFHGGQQEIPPLPGNNDDTRLIRRLQLQGSSPPNGYIKAIFAVGLFGGQISFSVLVTDIADPSELPSSYRSSFSKETGRLFLALSWTCFSFALG